jgi:predicted nucleotidyltransferase
MIENYITKIPPKYQKDVEAAASLLKNEGCTAVYLFGSLVTGHVHAESDIDLGIKGLEPRKFFSVYGKLATTLSNTIDLVDFDDDERFFTFLQSIDEVVKIA